MDYGKLFEYAGRITTGVLLMLILISGAQGYWIYGSQYKELQSERDTWKQLALKAANLSQEVAASPRVIGMAPPVDTHPLPSDASIAQVEQTLEKVEKKTEGPNP